MIEHFMLLSASLKRRWPLRLARSRSFMDESIRGCCSKSWAVSHSSLFQDCRPITGVSIGAGWQLKPCKFLHGCIREERLQNPCG